jgi:hypothetical protein
LNFFHQQAIWTDNKSDELSESDLIEAINDVDRSGGYLGSFQHVSFEWDKTCLSQYLMTDLSEEERNIYFDTEWDSFDDQIIDLTQTSQRLCRSTTSMHSFKTAFGTEPLRVG